MFGMQEKLVILAGDVVCCEKEAKELENKFQRVLNLESEKEGMDAAPFFKFLASLYLISVKLI